MARWVQAEPLKVRRLARLKAPGSVHDGEFVKILAGNPIQTVKARIEMTERGFPDTLKGRGGEYRFFVGGQIGKANRHRARVDAIAPQQGGEKAGNQCGSQKDAAVVRTNQGDVSGDGAVRRTSAVALAIS